jgi:hypothetical protein
MNEKAIAAKLLMFIASGGTLERIVNDLPMFKTQIESAFDWLKNAGVCTDAEVNQRAKSLQEATRQKDEAIKLSKFDLAGRARARECAFWESFGLEKLSAEAWHTILYIGIDEQIRSISKMF